MSDPTTRSSPQPGTNGPVFAQPPMTPAGSSLPWMLSLIAFALVVGVGIGRMTRNRRPRLAS